ncbi:MAG: histidine kinase N-terminal domain-containing protein [Mycobacterium sp.]|nr:histidine kinase N-terminal domain-containing protein [Mycobacterium sp.]
MSILSDLLAEHTKLTPPDVDHLQRLVGEWQLLSDLSFADLVLWAPTTDDEVLCVAQVRPTTGPTSYQDDRVGRRQSLDSAFELAVALREGRICREADPDWDGDLPVRREAIPVRRDGRIIALLSRDTNLASARSPSALELAYLQGAAELCHMIAEGSFPAPGEDPEVHAGPRVGDGLLRLDVDGMVTYASPNALSAYRRLGVTGDVRGIALASLTQSLSSDPFDGEEVADRITKSLEGATPPRMEVEADGATVLVRALPLLFGGQSRGALVLVRDVTDVRRRDRQLMSKDATIREIHHRVKNNLQTVAALLRLQARRVDVPEAREALQESVRRVSSIAMVHETLAMSPDEKVEFDGIVDRLLGMVAEVAAPESPVQLCRSGEFGELSADIATPLVMVLTELMQNAVEHAFIGSSAGTVEVLANRTSRSLEVIVRDDGVGLPEGFDLESSDRLGLQIVRTLIESELRGAIELVVRAGGGTDAGVTVPLIHRN